MTFFPASIVLILLWFVRSVRGIDNAVPIVVAVLPMGMFAAIRLGELSILAMHLLAMLTIGVYIFRWLAKGAPVARGALMPAELFLVFFAIYSVFSATILVRLFAGEFMVFPMTVTTTGSVVSFFFPSTMLPLAPGKSNIAQALYIVLSCGFFVVCLGLFRRRTPQIGEIGLVWAASLNVLLGLLDWASLDDILNTIRTADYTLANEHTLAGFPRIIGGFSEASSFGAASAAFFSYFMMSYLIGKRSLHFLLALTNLLAAVISFSTSGLFAVAAACIVMLLHIRLYFRAGMSRSFGHWFVIMSTGMVAALAVLIQLPGVVDTAADVLDMLVFSKSTSWSGLERGAWAWSGFDAFVQTWGLGAGVGSLRANGLTAVLLGTVGIPGALAFIGFVFASIGGSAAYADSDDHRMFYAARVLALTLLSSRMLATTSPDPTLFFALAAAIALAAKLRSGDLPHVSMRHSDQYS